MSGRVFSRVPGAVVPLGRRLRYLIVPLVLLAQWPCTGAESYVDSIQVEAEKLGGGAVTAKPAEGGGKDGRGDFERLLEERYRGTFLFYQELPAKSQEEALLEYQGGASIEDVRKTIMSRFLHNR
jgi:hypothetical protein